MNKIKPGDKILARFFNVPENRSYGPTFQAGVISITAGRYFVMTPAGCMYWLKRREIIRRIK